MPATADLERVLRGASLRVTRPRIAVLAVVHELPHADTSAIGDRVREEFGDVSQQAVYDVLSALTTAGLVRRIHPPGSLARYEARVGDNHHHLICRACATVTDDECTTGAAPCLTPADDHGYTIDEAEIVYWGLCPACLAASNSDSNASAPRSSP